MKIQIVDETEEKDFEEAIAYLKKINLDNITPIKALNLLYELKEFL